MSEERWRCREVDPGFGDFFEKDAEKKEKQLIREGGKWTGMPGVLILE